MHIQEWIFEAIFSGDRTAKLYLTSGKVNVSKDFLSLVSVSGLIRATLC
ncbi:hypothetical protein COO91_10283 (plasmid) [Nostoc flagelliforme CCNUN1]|uniref:Uncharacterized protein n=1 Tax=Nostoc flagelliforme CCNUN1 TaxID=2038116 RepID=A0A2K8T8N6_9NOSO|nr:hypothetical protein COO91_10283 [Nostoc flagelliforme CCNUN1]